MTNTIIKAQESDAKIISDLAEKIWWPTYSPILSKEQIALMLQERYSIDALRSAMRAREDFFLLENNDGVKLGFISLKQMEDILRIEKLYVLVDQHGRGYGRMLLDFAEKEARKHLCNYLELNVNRKNPAKIFYEKMGFHIVCEADIPYGAYILDDYVMQQAILYKD